MILKLKEALAKAKERTHNKNTKKYLKKYYLTVLKPKRERFRTGVGVETQRK
jgi:hypothetical protein